VNRKADFLLNESIRIDSHNESNRIDSNRELECSTVKPSTVVGRAFPVAWPTIWSVRLWISVTAGRGIFSTGAACVHRISNSCPWCNRPASYRSLWMNCCRIEPRSRTFALRTSAPGHLFPPPENYYGADRLFIFTQLYFTTKCDSKKQNRNRT